LITVFRSGAGPFPVKGSKVVLPSEPCRFLLQRKIFETRFKKRYGGRIKAGKLINPSPLKFSVRARK